MLEDILDFLVFVIVMSVVTGNTLIFTIPLVTNMVESRLDKSGRGEVLYEPEEDVGLSAEEVLLMSQVQDATMPLPRRYYMGDEVIKVETTYKLVIREIGVQIWDKLEGGKKYQVKYDYRGVDGGVGDNLGGFRIEEKVA